MSNAMDVGDPSNFARLAELYGLSVEGMRAQVRGERVSEAETRAAIRQAYAESGTILDPHAAVGFAAARRLLAEGGPAPVLVLATAHPAKFADVIHEELGLDPALPEAERDWRSRPLLAVDLPEAGPEAVRDLLNSLRSRSC
jgi:threonine synthase